MARRRVGMSNKQMFYRSLALMSAFFMLISCFVLITTLVMDITGINIFDREEPRKYCIYFWSEDRFLAGRDGYVRGEKIQIPGNPTHEEDEYFQYTFRGWDINGDNSPDIIPTRAYYGFDAVAVYQKKQIKPLPKSYDEPDNSDGDNSSSSGEPSTISLPWIVKGVDGHGA